LPDAEGNAPQMWYLPRHLSVIPISMNCSARNLPVGPTVVGGLTQPVRGPAEQRVAAVDEPKCRIVRSSATVTK